MPFGGLAPLPLRLGGSPELGLTFEQHARLCADTVAVKRTTPAMVLRVQVDGTLSSVTPLSYSGPNGSGLQYAPLVDWDSSTVRVYLGEPTNNHGFAVDALGITGLDFVVETLTNNGAGLDVSLVDGGATISIPWAYAGVSTITILIYTATDVAIGDYGGHLAKRNSTTEGYSTYAFAWYRMLKAAQGSAYSTSDTSVRSWTLKAEARSLGTSQRISEMLAASATPHGSDMKLGRWAQIEGIQTANLPKWLVREQCELRYSDRDPITLAEIESTLAAILGNTFVDVVRNLGTIGSPPEPSYWPGILNGDAAYDLTGEGVYSSPRGRITVHVNQGAYSDDELMDLMTRDVAVWLDSALPATGDWQWTTTTTGFLLGTSKLGFDSL